MIQYFLKNYMWFLYDIIRPTAKVKDEHLEPAEIQMVQDTKNDFRSRSIKITNNRFFSISNFIILYIFSTSILFGLESEGESDLSKRPITLKVYLLHPSTRIGEAIRETDSDNKTISYTWYNCNLNQGCKWISKPRTLTTPSFWQLVHEGTGINLEEIDEQNTSEHWLYYVETLGQKFGVILGQGDFFKSKKYEFTEKNTPSDKEQEFEYFGIDETYGDTKFGYRAVQNIVEAPERLAKEKGTIGGKPYNNFCSDIKGLDYCSITLRCTLNQIPNLCQKLWYFSKNGSYTLFKTIKETALLKKKELHDVTEKVLSKAKKSSETESQDDEAEGKVIEYEKGKEATKIFGKYWQFEGLTEYIQETSKQVKELINERVIKLREFKEKVIKEKFLQLHPKKDTDITQTPSNNKNDENSNSKKKKSERIDYEGVYNLLEAENDSNLILLDKKCVENVEVCDLLHKPTRTLVHVKRGTDSSVLNHLFGQGTASATLLAQAEYRVKIPHTLTRLRIIQLVKEHIKERYKLEKDHIMELFKKWRLQSDEKIKSGVSNQKIKEKREFLEKIKTLTQTPGDKSQQPSIEDLNKDIENQKKELEDEFYRALSPKEKLVLEFKDENFLEPNDQLFALHIALNKDLRSKEAFKTDHTLKEIIDLLDKYRSDLVETCINECYESLNLSDLDDKSFPTALLDAYKKKKVKRITEKDLESIIRNETVTKIFKDTFETFNPINIQPSAFTVVYAIITPKNQADKELLPLGARINLLNSVKEIKNLPGKLQFKVAIRIIPEISESSKNEDNYNGEERPKKRQKLNQKKK